MKKLILIFIILSVGQLTYSQQEVSENKWSIGVEGGISASQGRLTFKFRQSRNAIYHGLNLNYQMSDRASFTTGLQYLREGYRYATCIYLPFDEQEINGLRRNNFLTVPAFFNFHLGKERKFIVTTGFYGAYLLSSNSRILAGGCGNPGEIWNHIDGTHSFYLGAMIGFGYQFINTDSFTGKVQTKLLHSVTPLGSDWRNNYLVSFSLDYKLGRGLK